MDSARFGRVLGIGTRLAGKTIVQAVDAASSPNPRAGQAVPPPQRVVTVIPPVAAPTKVTRQGVARGGKKFGEAVWKPFVRSGKVLWLEVTGVFFALPAAVGIQGIWMHRAGIAAGASPDERRHLWMGVLMAVVFGYFCVSSFVRASRKSKS